MDDPPALPDPHSNNDAADSLNRDRRSPPRTPRWALVLAIIALVLIVAVAVQLVFGIRHGPGLHSAPIDSIPWLFANLR
jgi:hypothetical protein